MKPSPTKYAKSGDVSIAYRVQGDGPLDVVYNSPGTGSFEMYEQEPEAERYADRLSSFCRLISFDKRGVGLSDRVTMGTAEERIDDIRAVMDAAGSDHAAIFGLSEGGPMAILFAATYPERVTALVLYGSFAHNPQTDDELARQLKFIDEHWGEGLTLHDVFRRWLPDDKALAAAGRAERTTASPGAVKALARMNQRIDVRGALSAITAPSLVLHKTLDNRVPVEAGRYIARMIPGATFKELPGVEHIPEGGDWELIVDEVEEFLTGMKAKPVPERVLATVLFTDIVDSTPLTGEVGDRRWKETLDRHDEMTKQHVQRFRGRWIKSTGDGILATFDGPARAITCAREIRDGAQRLGLKVRAGLHIGECELRGGDVAGIAVNIAQRVSSIAGEGEILVSRTLTDLVSGSDLEFDERGEHDLKGVAGTWQLYAVRS